MADKQPLSSGITILIDGSKVPESVLSQLAEIVIDQHVLLPDMFTIRLYNPHLELLDKGPFDLTKEITIKAANAKEKRFTLIKGEITALEPHFGEGMVSELVVRGYDKSHRLYRKSKSRAFLNKKDSDLAEEIARDAGLTPEVDVTQTVYDHVYQHNQSDLAFLMQRAWRIGYECFVEDDKLYFRQPPASQAGLTLTWGDDLLTFNPRMTLAEQVDEVVVRGWDADKQTPIVGQAQQGELYPEIKESKNGAEWSQPFGKGKLVIVDQPVVSQAEANNLAMARLNELSGTFVQAEGEAYRRPELKAGQWVKLDALGSRLNGQYLVTSATHVYNTDGFRTRFTVRGSRTGSLLELTNHKPPIRRWPGVVTAVVTNTDDPQNWGRVKVKFPWMTEDAESDWARLAAPGAGPEAGFYALPEVDDEVLVAFEHGDFSRPTILGSLWNGQHNVPPTITGAAQNERPLRRTWHSRTGHAITMYDDSDNKVEIKTAEGHTLTLDDNGSQIEIKSSGGLTITLDDNNGTIKIEANGKEDEIELKTGGNMKLEAGGNMDIKANGQVNVKGAMVNLN